LLIFVLNAAKAIAAGPRSRYPEVAQGGGSNEFA
jgi:hypothetical protein